jgi:glucans biosynthesis protein C
MGNRVTRPTLDLNRLDSTDRLHALDSLRASMMLLGIVLHVLSLYIDFPLGRIPDSGTSAAFDFGFLLLHVFRMPVFFMMSGFFAALLLTRRGARRFITNRTGRIVVPFVVGWLPLFVLVWMSAAYAVRQSHGKFIIADEGFRLGLFVRDEGLVHLWFLYYLIFYYALAIGAWEVWRRLPAGPVTVAKAYFARLAPSPVGCALLCLLTFPALFSMRLGILATSLSFIPRPAVLYVYGLFFFFGVALYSQRDLLPVLRRGAWTRVLLGLAVFPLNFLATRFQGNLLLPDLRARALAAATGSISGWLLTLGLLGLFLGYANAPNRYIRYLTDAAYWLYLVHLPLVNYIGGLLAPTVLPLWLKALLTLVIAIPLLLLSYHLMVRSTFIGKTLNGRKYPRSLPEVEIKTLHAAA